jgi:serine/threonine protein kinase
MDDLSADSAGSEAPTRSRYALWDMDVPGDSKGDNAAGDNPAGDDEDDALSALVSRRYELGRLIGSGGTARVYRAYDHSLDREVAIKVFHRDVVPVEQRRRLHEVAVMGRLDHPGVVPLFDTGDEDGHTFLVMRLVDGQNLADRLRSGPLPPGDVTALTTQLSDALAYVHARGVTHRDLKPANILLGDDGPVISDFGIAQSVDATRVTATGAIVGTAAYMAPEQVLGDLVGSPADIYSLGLILLECLTGVREYTGTMAECAIARLTRQPRLPQDLPPALARLLRQMTARVPAQRPTAAVVRQTLSADEEAPSPVDAPTTIVARPVPRGHRGVLVGTLAAGAAVIAAVCVFGLPTAVQGNPASSPPPTVSSPPSPVAPQSPSSSAPNPVAGLPQTQSGAEPAGIAPAPAPAPGIWVKPGKNAKKHIPKGEGRGGGHGDEGG